MVDISTDMYIIRQEFVVAAAEIRDTATAIKEFYTSPAVVFGAKVTKDGDAYCCLYGDDLQSGIAGFGHTAKAAVEAFNRKWDGL